MCPGQAEAPIWGELINRLRCVGVCGPVCLNTLSSPIRILQAFSFHDLRGRFCIGAGL